MLQEDIEIVCFERTKLVIKYMLVEADFFNSNAWLIHEVPTRISLTGQQVVAQFNGPGSLEKDGSEMVIRMMATVEIKCITSLNRGRWRHILLPIWAVSNVRSIIKLSIKYIYDLAIKLS